jgi:hypothetical protein
MCNLWISSINSILYNYHCHDQLWTLSSQPRIKKTCFFFKNITWNTFTLPPIQALLSIITYCEFFPIPMWMPPSSARSSLSDSVCKEKTLSLSSFIVLNSTHLQMYIFYLKSTNQQIRLLKQWLKLFNLELFRSLLAFVLPPRKGLGLLLHFRFSKYKLDLAMRSKGAQLR